MNRVRTREVIDKLGIPVEKSDGHGIEIQRWVYTSGIGEIQQWRVYTGGGIAGNSDKVWLTPVRKHVALAQGPYWNKTQLEKALRAWRRGE
jgi:hypothetical protein